MGESLWLGDMHFAYDDSKLRAHGITHVIKCAAELPREKEPHPFVTHTYIDMKDNHRASAAYIFEGADAVHGALKDPRAVVLVHCAAGISRSPSVVIAYLVKYRGMSVAGAWQHVRARRPVVRPYAGFMEHVQRWATWERWKALATTMTLRGWGRGDASPKPC